MVDFFFDKVCLKKSDFKRKTYNGNEIKTPQENKTWKAVKIGAVDLRPISYTDEMYPVHSCTVTLWTPYILHTPWLRQLS